MTDEQNNSDYKPNFSAQDAAYFSRRLREELEKAGHREHVIAEGTPEEMAKLAHSSGDFSELKRSLPIRNEYLRLYGVREFERQNGAFIKSQSQKKAAAEREQQLADQQRRRGPRIF